MDDKFNPEITPASHLIEVTEEQAVAAKAYFEETAEAWGWQLKARTPGTTITMSARPAAATAAEPTDLDDPFDIGRGQVGLTEEELRDLVAAIPNNDVPYEGADLTWFNILAAIHHETDGSEVGYNIAHIWSDQSTKHEEERFNKTWNSFTSGEKERPVTARLLIRFANQFKKIAVEAQVDDLIAAFELAKDIAEITKITLECRKLDVEPINRQRLIAALQAAVKRKTGTALGIREAREMVRFRLPEGEVPEWLEGWCYLRHAERFFQRSTGAMVKREGFDAAFGRFVGSDTTASKYALDTAKIEVFHMNVYLPNAEEVFTDHLGLRWINTYKDTAPAMPERLTAKDLRNRMIIDRHFYHLFEDERETRILISWLAYIVQTRKRINWMPVIQGAEAIGKTFIADLLNVVLGGQPHVYKLDTEVLTDSPFTDWSGGHQVIFIEEIKVYGHQYDVMNKLKPRITDDTVTQHAKGISPYNIPNATSYIAATNHRDALPLDESDTRYFPMMSRWQLKEDVDKFKRDNPTYYRDLHAALAESPGAIRQWLLEYPLHPEFRPNDRAPFSRAKVEIIEEAKSDEQLDLEELIGNRTHPLVTTDLIIVQFLRELMIDEGGIYTGALSTSVGIRHLMKKMSFRSKGRIYIGSDRYQCWVRGAELTKLDAIGLKQVILDRIDADNHPL